MDDKVLELKNFGVGYGQRMLLCGVDTGFGSGTLTALLGRNGAGKSTLLRALAGLGRYTGRVDVCGVDLRKMPPRELAKRISFVSTERTRIAAMRCRDIVAMGRAPYTGWTGRLSAADEEIVDSSLRAVGMQDYADRTADTMSDGECQRVMIARALAQDTPVMLLDEPTSFLDLPNRYELCDLLGRLAHDKNKCVIFSTHELDIAIALSDRIALIDSPELINLDTEEMLRRGHIARLFDPHGRIPEALWNLRR